jgi:hypothetical protein
MYYFIITLLYILFSLIAIIFICCIIELFKLAIESIQWGEIFTGIAQFSMTIMMTVIVILSGIYLVKTGTIFHPSMWF